MNNLELLFNLVLKQARKLRKAHPTTFDGKGFWQPIKTILEQFDKHSAKRWKNLSKLKREKIMQLPEYTIDGYENKVINLKNHFIIQQVRIPMKEEPTIKKIIQIALNIGQYQGVNNEKYIYNVKLNNIHQFLYNDDIDKLSTYLSDDIIEQIKSILN